MSSPSPGLTAAAAAPAERGLGRVLRKVAIAIAGFAVLGAGVALIVLPGPAMVVIPIGLAILAREFVWARRLLVYLKGLAKTLWARRPRFGRACQA